MNEENRTPAAPATPKIETESCSRCGGSGRYSWCEMHRDICFRCGGSGKTYTKRGAAAAAYLLRLRCLPLSEIKPGMLVADRESAFTKQFRRVLSIGPRVLCGWSGAGENRVEHYGATLHMKGLSHGGLQPETLRRVGQTANGRAESFRLAIEFQAKLTKAGALRKEHEGTPDAEKAVQTLDRAGWWAVESAAE